MISTLLISEGLVYPFDEGQKNITRALIKELESKTDLCVVTKKPDQSGTLACIDIAFNKLFLNAPLKALLKNKAPEIILYVPEASCTFNSFLRARVLKLMYRRAKVGMLATQHRSYSFLQDLLLRYVRPDLLLLLSPVDKDYFEKKGIRTQVLPPAVDKEKFHRVTLEEKTALRKKYNVPLDKTVLLHVGHIKRNRNLESLFEIKKQGDYHIIVVGSTSTKAADELKLELENAGIMVIHTYLPDIHELYQLSDIYLFPVLQQDAAIDMPASLLEAMACNICVLTTKFGAVAQYFSPGPCFRYFDSLASATRALQEMLKLDCDNYKRVKSLTWTQASEAILDAFKRVS